MRKKYTNTRLHIFRKLMSAYRMVSGAHRINNVPDSESLFNVIEMLITELKELFRLSDAAGKPRTDDETRAKIQRLYRLKRPYKTIAADCKVSKSTVYHTIKNNLNYPRKKACGRKKDSHIV